MAVFAGTEGGCRWQTFAQFEVFEPVPCSCVVSGCCCCCDSGQIHDKERKPRSGSGDKGLEVAEAVQGEMAGAGEVVATDKLEPNDKSLTFSHIRPTITRRTMNHALPAIQHAYAQCAYTPQHNQWTVLASVFLTNNDDYKIIGLATGTKCLPATRLSPRGESLHDSHAEALARRAALRWLLQETQSPASPWLTQTPNGRYTLRPSVKLNLYVSTLPCGDASMRSLAALQDPTIASLKSTSLFPSLAPGAASRGRDDYARLGVLRTKPGRADSPPTPCLSCSDKIARWSVLGIQGALGAHLLEPLYLENIIIGEVPSDLREIALEDCTRAFSGRVGVIPDLPEGYALHPPTIHFTEIPFIHSRTVLQSSTSCIESLCLVADTPPEILINGLKRGVSPKHRYREKSRPSISRIAMLNLVLNLTPQSASTPPPNLNPTPNPTSIESNLNSNPTYHHLKLQSHSYQAARSKLTGPDGPFSGWVLSGSHLQNFNARGEEVVPVSTPDSLSLSASSEVKNVSEQVYFQ